MGIIKKLLDILFKLKNTPIVKEPEVKEVFESDPEVVEFDPIEEPIRFTKNYNSLPLPEVDASMKAAIPLLLAVEQVTGANAKVMALIIDLESNFRATVKAPTSSARGWFQIIDKTYKTLLTRHANEYFIPTNSETDLRLDPRVNCLLGAELVKENGRILKNTLKREPELLEYYIMHFLGASVARKFLVLADNVVVADLMPIEAKANTWIFYNNNGKGSARTAKEVKDSLEVRITRTLADINKYFK